MPNLIVGLKYQPDFSKVETEEQLLEVFADLRAQYSELSPNFEMATSEGRTIRHFRDFLGLAVQEKQAVVMRGSGNIGGLVVEDANLEYDLSKVGELVKYWDIHRDGSCHSCHSLGRKNISQDGGDWYCTIGISPMKWKNCSKYSPLARNSSGRAARELDALVEEAVR